MYLLKKIITVLTLSVATHGVSQAAIEYAQAVELNVMPVGTPYLEFQTAEQMADIVLRPYVSMEDIYP